MSDDGWRTRIRWVVVHPDREAVLVARRDGTVRLPEVEQPGQVWSPTPPRSCPACATCSAPTPSCCAAWRRTRTRRPGSSGPVEHVRTWCLNGHGYTQRLDVVTGWPMERARRPLSAGG